MAASKPDPNQLTAGGLLFDEEAYNRALPYFQQAWTGAKAAGVSLGEFVNLMADALIHQVGWDPKPVQRMIRRFAREEIRKQREEKDAGTDDPGGEGSEEAAEGVVVEGSPPVDGRPTEDDGGWTPLESALEAARWADEFTGYTPMNNNPLYCHISSKRIAELIQQAKGSICYAGPGIQKEPAEALSEAVGRIGSDKVTVALDFDERVLRMGYGAEGRTSPVTPQLRTRPTAVARPKFPSTNGHWLDWGSIVTDLSWEIGKISRLFSVQISTFELQLTRGIIMSSNVPVLICRFLGEPDRSP
ncbi:MAG: hypothetical protein F7O42_12520 [Opitutae bacterium]|nr:hypothetical protein [Opitutae bacterium]